MSTSNPKAAVGATKAPLDYLEPAADEEIAKALKFGADKYGARNFTQTPIDARTYVAAMRRHITAWLEGEDCAEDSGVHHLGHIGANVHVALAAMRAGTFVDNRHGREDATAEATDVKAEVERREAT